MDSDRISKQEYKDAVRVMLEYKQQIESDLKDVDNDILKVSPFAFATPDDELIKTNLRVRELNILNSVFHRKNNEAYNPYSCKMTHTVGDLANITEYDILVTRNSGRKTLEIIRELCSYAGVTMKKK